jgi:hypothetical protein
MTVITMMIDNSEQIAVDLVCKMTPSVAQIRVSELTEQQRLEGVLESYEREELMQLRLGLALVESDGIAGFDARFSSHFEQYAQNGLI